ncbi:MAG: hypothetical protein WBM90_05350 [Acidimicrobiia bacterium]
MNRYQTAGVMWLIAAALSATATVVFREDTTWFVITIVASAIAAVLGILLLLRPNRTTGLLSALGGIAWVTMYAVLIVIQSDDVQAWSADAVFLLVGAAASLIGFSGGRQAAR